MKCYDARIIEGCCVFSYEIQPPEHSENNSGKRKPSARSSDWKKKLLRFILLLMLPFTLLWNRAKKAVTRLSRRLHRFFRECSRCRALTACLISSVSATALIPLAFLIL